MSGSAKNTVRDSLSVALTVGAYGVAFGAASVAAGFSVLQSCLFSLLTFTGASQFAAVGVVASGGAPLSAIAAATMLGTRNALYGIQMAPLLRVRGLRRVTAAHLTIDESTAVATGAPPALAGYGFWTTAFSVYALWNLATLVGAVGAATLDPRRLGLDAAVGAAFLALLWPRLRAARSVAAGGMLLAAVAIPLTPPGVPVLVAGLAVLPAVLPGRR